MFCSSAPRRGVERNEIAPAASGRRKPLPYPAQLTFARRTSAPAQQPAHAGDPATEHEPGNRGPDQDLLLVRHELAAPVGDDRDLLAELLDGHAELGAVRLDRLTDLLRGAGGHQRGTLSGTAVPGRWVPETVSRMSCASSIASSGLGGVAFLMKRKASRPPRAPSRNRISVTIRKPSQGP